MTSVPYKRRLGHRHAHIYRKYYVKTQRKSGHLQVKEIGLRRNQYLDLLTFRTMRNKLLLFTPPSLYYFVMPALANKYQFSIFFSTCVQKCLLYTRHYGENKHFKKQFRILRFNWVQNHYGRAYIL